MRKTVQFFVYVLGILEKGILGKKIMREQFYSKREYHRKNNIKLSVRVLRKYIENLLSIFTIFFSTGTCYQVYNQCLMTEFSLFVQHLKFILTGQDRHTNVEVNMNCAPKTL